MGTNPQGFNFDFIKMIGGKVSSIVGPIVEIKLSKKFMVDFFQVEDMNWKEEKNASIYDCLIIMRKNLILCFGLIREIKSKSVNEGFVKIWNQLPKKKNGMIYFNYLKYYKN